MLRSSDQINPSVQFKQSAKVISETVWTDPLLCATAAANRDESFSSLEIRLINPSTAGRTPAADSSVSADNTDLIKKTDLQILIPLALNRRLLLCRFLAEYFYWVSHKDYLGLW